MFLMTWALARLLALCGTHSSHSSLVTAQSACIYTGRHSCIVVVTPMFLMIWAVARLLAPCGKHSCLVTAQYACI